MTGSNDGLAKRRVRMRATISAPTLSPIWRVVYGERDRPFNCGRPEGPPHLDCAASLGSHLGEPQCFGGGLKRLATTRVHLGNIALVDGCARPSGVNPPLSASRPRTRDLRDLAVRTSFRFATVYWHGQHRSSGSSPSAAHALSCPAKLRQVPRSRVAKRSKCLFCSSMRSRWTVRTRPGRR